MGTFVGIAAAGVLLVCLFLSGASRCFSQTPANPPPGKTVGPPAATTVEEIKSLDRGEIRTMLKRLADTPAPKERALGACCYGVAAPVWRAIYICPKCGERTVYDDNKVNAKKSIERGLAKLVDRGIPSCRREMEGIRKKAGNAITLDESQFCRKCSPNVTAPKLVVHISYKGEKPRDVEGISHGDLQLLREFLAGRLLTTGDQGQESPLKDRLSRLEELLGVKLEK